MNDGEPVFAGGGVRGRLDPNPPPVALNPVPRYHNTTLSTYHRNCKLDRLTAECTLIILWMLIAAFVSKRTFTA